MLNLIYLLHEEGEKNNAYYLGLMNSKYTRLDLHKVTDEEGTATDKKAIMEKVKGFYQKLFLRAKIFPATKILKILKDITVGSK